ncbi:hypothetical protein EVAR_22863_1 [Eumeta japonica]|uniref:Uncharacterized protein n=1 Tax=Eumeta variegata TaxID=151549 RepID=A0A4C1UU49_EUMVA|nr:hypothetical protein EVAR_22863_1 [Eumeta japonica]
MPWSTWLWYENGPAQSVKYHSLTEYRHHKVTSAVAFRPVSDSSGGLLPLYHPTYRSSVHYPFHQTSYSYSRVTFDSDPDPIIVYDPSPVHNFGSGFAFDSDPGPVPHSALHPAINHSFDFNEAGD